ncbi:MAG: hypothetical protein V3U27_21365 [Candidatus Tectomicrobia bacterium]
MATDLKDRVNGQQSRLDDQAVEQYLQTYSLSLYDPGQNEGTRGESGVEAVGTGMVGFLVDQDVSVLGSRPWNTVLGLGGKTADLHASGKLEPWLNTAMWLGTRGIKVWEKQVLRLRLLGYTFSKVLPAPQLLAGDELEELVEDLNKLIARGASEELIKEQNGKIDDWKRDNPAIVWRDVGRRTYAVYDDMGLSEVVEFRWIDRYVVESLMGDLPGDLKGRQIEVVEWANDKYVGTLLRGIRGVGARNAEFIKEPWEHGLGINPYVLMEGDPMPEMSETPESAVGWFYKGAAFHLRNMLPAVDEVMSDLVTSFHAETIAPPLLKSDIETRVKMGLEEKEIKVDGNNAVNILLKEDAGRFPTQQINPDALRFVGMAQQFANQSGLFRPALTGAMLSGQSAVGLEESRQIATAELKIPHAALAQGFADAGGRFFRAVISLARDFPDTLAEITVRKADAENQSKAITVTPKDVKPYVLLIRGNVELAIPTNEGLQIQNAVTATNPQHPLVSDDTARARWLSDKNPSEEGNRLIAQGLVQAGSQILQQVLLQRFAAGVGQMGAQGIQQLQARAEQLPLEAQQAIQGSGILSGVGRAQANRGQAGAPQQQSVLQGQNLRTP